MLSPTSVEGEGGGGGGATTPKFGKQGLHCRRQVENVCVLLYMKIYENTY